MHIIISYFFYNNNILLVGKSALGKCDTTNIFIGHKSLPFNFTFLFRMHNKVPNLCFCAEMSNNKENQK